jgi:hypothetical protein
MSHKKTLNQTTKSAIPQPSCAPSTSLSSSCDPFPSGVCAVVTHARFYFQHTTSEDHRPPATPSSQPQRARQHHAGMSPESSRNAQPGTTSVRTISRVTKQAKPSQRHQPPTTPTNPFPSSMASILASIATPATNWVAGVGKVEGLLRGRPLNLVCALVGVAGGQSFKICGPNSAQGCKKTVASWEPRHPGVWVEINPDILSRLKKPSSSYGALT